MDGPRGSGPTPTDPAHGHRSWRPSLGYLAIGLVIVAGGLAYGLVSVSSPAPFAAASQSNSPVAVNGSTLAQTGHAAASATAPAAPEPPVAAANGPAVAVTQEISRTRDPNGDLTPDIAGFVNKGERPTMGEVIDRLHQAGVHSGLGAFSPPGTRPPLVGLAVPEEFALPPGYVRHYQATDDGQRIEPILMYAPDHSFLDAAGRPMAIPEDRVVPPELAPPGLPIRRIVIPAPTEPGRPGR